MFQRIDTYLNHHVIIEADDSYTRIILVPQRPTSDYFHVNDPPLTLEKVKDLLALPGLAPLRRGYVYAEDGGQKIYYQQPGGVTRDNQASILPLLAKLAGAYPKIVTLGGAAASTLQLIITDETHPLQPLSQQLLEDVAAATEAALGNYTLEQLLCPQCLVYFAKHSIQSSLSEKSISLYGCRACGQSREFLAWQGQIVAVLAADMAEPEARTDEAIRANWLHRRSLFDFDTVEIIRATDEEVERLAMQIGNDTDPVRRLRYPEMTCTLSSTCALSENTLRILQRTFGQVVS